MTPKEAVETLAKILADQSIPVEEDAIYDALEAAGMPDDVADKAYKFVLLACGRVLLQRMGVKAPNEYYAFDGQGEIAESGEVSEEPNYVAALELDIPQLIGQDVFSKFSVMSSEVNAVNQAMMAGSNLNDLVLLPVTFFIEMPTDEAMGKVQQFIRGLAARS